MLHQRASGLLLHITSLPNALGPGDFGPAAYEFVNFLHDAGQQYWQILPLTPVDAGAGFSPYSSPSAFAGNPLLISLDKISETGLLPPQWAALKLHGHSSAAVEAYWDEKMDWLRRAADRFLEDADAEQQGELARFCVEHAHWLNDYALFMALREHTGIYDWTRWPAPVARHQTDAVAQQREALRAEVTRQQVLQYWFFGQWRALRAYAAQKGVHIIGDVPIYVQHQSADVWANQPLFKLDDAGQPRYVAGSPPDLFSESGQRWGNPVYDWQAHEVTGFAWWERRLRHQLALHSLTRLDHFLGFAVYWEIPAEEQTAQVGEWVAAPIDAFLKTMYARLVHMPVIAEDLGARTPDVQPFLRHYALPGMRLAHIGFGEDMGTSTHAVHNFVENCVAYTGTHDNNTMRGWFTTETDARERANLNAYFGIDITENNVAAHLCRRTLQSVARLVMLPMQDVLGLGTEARMNVPGRATGNWFWQLRPGQLTDNVAQQLRQWNEQTGRASVR